MVFLPVSASVLVLNVPVPVNRNFFKVSSSFCSVTQPQRTLWPTIPVFPDNIFALRSVTPSTHPLFASDI
jgi:hypothetical protein